MKIMCHFKDVFFFFFPGVLREKKLCVVDDAFYDTYPHSMHDFVKELFLA